MSRISFIFLFTITSFLTHAQEAWNWPTDPELKSISQEKQAYYKVLMSQEKYEEALSTQYWLFKNNPDLHSALYKDGAKIIENLLDEDLSDTRKNELEDSLLWTYDMRIKYFQSDKASAIDRRAYAAFKLYYKNPAQYKRLAQYYDDLFQLDASEISKFNITPYMTLATYYYKSNPDEMPAESVLDIHERISAVISTKINSGEKEDVYKKEQDKIDAFLSSLSGILNCDFIKDKLVPKLEANPEDLNTAKKIFSYSLKAKCTNEPYFITAGSVLYKDKPTFALAKALADRNYINENYGEALEYYMEAAKYATSNTENYQAFYAQALTQSKLENKSAARSMARQALSENPEATDPYNLIGNLYFGSYEECRGGESKVTDRAVFIAAYNMYVKSGNTTQMEASKNQFPSIEDIFNENKAEGESVLVGCWINESVSLIRR